MLISKCENCQAPKNTPVARRIADPEIWALDLDLIEEFPDAWKGPVKVYITYSGICRECEMKYMGPKDARFPHDHLYYGRCGGTLVVDEGETPTREKRG